MVLSKRLHGVFSVEAIVLLALLLLVSIGLAQDEGWTQMTDIPTARAFLSSCILDGKAYVIGGGFNAITSTDIMEVYDIESDTWDTTKAPMPTPRVEFAAAAVNGIIYAIGGAPGHNYEESAMQTVEAYDPLTDTWSTDFEPMPTPRSGLACGVIDDKIYVAGGTNGPSHAPLGVLEIFDTETGEWTTGAPMEIATYQGSGAVINDIFYRTGGLVGPPWEGQTTVQMYDPIADQWSVVASMYDGRVGHSTNVVDGKVYVIGGESFNQPVRNVEVYDPDLNSWDSFDDTPCVINVHSANEFGDSIYVFSGSSTGVPPHPTAAVWRYEPGLAAEPSDGSIPHYFALSQAHPNPFYSSTTIGFALPHSDFVTLKILNMLGEEVAAPVSERLESGNYECRWDASTYASGVYFYQLEVGEFTETKKMILAR